MFCIRCGKPNVAEAVFCYNCGNRLVGLENVANPPQLETISSKPVSNAEVVDTSGQPLAPGTINQEGPSAPVPGWPAQPPGWQAGSTPQMPPYPYGYPFRVPLAPNGKPYPVANNPDAFYAYKDKESRQIYAPLASIRQRFGAALLDTIIMNVFNSLLAGFILLLLLSPAEFKGLGNALQSGDFAESQKYYPNWLALLTGTNYLIYCTLFIWLAKGQTLGKKLLHIKIIKLTGTKPNFKDALLRSSFGFSMILGSYIAPFAAPLSLLYVGLSFMVIFGFTYAFRDKLHQGWHDKLAETVVVSSRELIQGVNY